MKSNLHHPIQILCFDFDGTVADTMPFLADIAVKIICKYYHVEQDFAKTRYIETTGLPFEQQIHAIFPEHAQNALAIQEFEAQKKANYFQLPPVSNVKKVLKHLHNKKYTLAISSSTFQELVDAYVGKYELPCDLALGYKPNFKKGKDHFECILQTFQGNPENICYIGDSLNDYRLAKMNNIQFIAKIGLFDENAFHQLNSSIPAIHNMDDLLSMF